MDILTHTLSGLAIGTVVAGFSNKGFINKTTIIVVAGLAAALPDADAISLWSKFDTTIGQFFNLKNRGSDIYFAKFWYSHRAFFHSIAAGLLITILLAFLSYLVAIIFRGFNSVSIVVHVKSQNLWLIGFFLGFISHGLGDMPTPASKWGGINFFWPAESYTGGWGKIWWWNNYDIFLIIAVVVMLNLSLLLLAKFIRIKAYKLATTIYLIGFGWVLMQISNRQNNFAYSGYTTQYQQLEQQSKAEQQAILGDRLYQLMERFDNQLKIYF